MNSQLSLAQVACQIQVTPQILRAQTHILDEVILRWRPEPGEWCIKEVIGHLIETDRRGFAGRIETMLAEDRPQLQAWDVEGTAAARRDHERNVVDLLSELDTMRRAGGEMIKRLSAGQLLRAGHHPQVGELKVVDLLHEWVFHDLNHLKQIAANIQHFVWPHMGNAQRFSAG